MAAVKKKSKRGVIQITKSAFALIVKHGGSGPSYDARKSLDRQCWYHGLCSREDAEKLLTKPGNFIVRASESLGDVTIVLSLYTGDKKVHLIIEINSKGEFYLNMDKLRTFATVYDLIKHYKAHRIKKKSENGAIVYYRLREGVPRPKWNVSSDWISYDANSTPLGAGHFAEVFMGTFWPDGTKKSKGIQVAVKVLKTTAGSTSDAEKDARQGMIREGKVMSFYSHPNVVQFYGTACDRPQQIILVMEYCPGGSLDKHLVAQKDKIVVAERITFCIESALGMRYLHSEGCLHRDLAARNCLISANGVVKIADFGLSSQKGINDVEKMGCMPIRWMSPETLVKEPVFSTKSDVWAYGILAFEIFNSGTIPWLGDDNKKVATLIRHCQMPEMPDITPPGIKELVASIWVKSMDDRPTFRTIVLKLSSVRDAGFPMPPAKECSVNQLPDVCRDVGEEDLADLQSAPCVSGVTSSLTSSTTTETQDSDFHSPTSLPSATLKTPGSRSPGFKERLSQYIPRKPGRRKKKKDR